MRIKATIEFELEDTFGIQEDDLIWLETEVLIADDNLILHSNDIGDTVGVIKKISNIRYFRTKPK